MVTFTAALPIFTLFFKDLIDGGFGGASGLDIKKVEETSLKFLYISMALIVVSPVHVKKNLCFLDGMFFKYSSFSVFLLAKSALKSILENTSERHNSVWPAFVCGGHGRLSPQAKVPSRNPTAGERSIYML
jgi:hypothetical protein